MHDLSGRPSLYAARYGPDSRAHQTQHGAVRTLAVVYRRGNAIRLWARPADGHWPYRLRFFFQAEDGIRSLTVTGVQTCALPIWARPLTTSGLTPSDPPP